MTTNRFAIKKFQKTSRNELNRIVFVLLKKKTKKNTFLCYKCVNNKKELYERFHQFVDNILILIQIFACT